MTTHTDRCEWGRCDAVATTTVTYPGIVPGTAGRERSADLVHLLSVCDSCRPVAQAEADEMYAELARTEREELRS